MCWFNNIPKKTKDQIILKGSVEYIDQIILKGSVGIPRSNNTKGIGGSN